MRCTNCRADNHADSHFCAACGAALTVACGACGHFNQWDARSCVQCGGPLTNHISPAVAAIAGAGSLKQATVLFADVSGSTEMIEDLDPDEAHKQLAPVLDAMTEAVRRFEGSIVRTQGDGIMAMFGAPVPQEDHAVRACSAALALQGAIKTLPGVTSLVRVGVHSGEVLAHTAVMGSATVFDATGVAVHIARRLEQLAPVGRVAISTATLRAARLFVSVESIGIQQIRGLSAPMEVFLLTGLQGGPTSLRFASGRERSDFVGRYSELARLDRALERANGGEGLALGVVADAGVGKSRLCFEFAYRCRARGVIVFEGRALPQNRHTPYALASEVMRSYFQVSSDDPPEKAREKVESQLRSFAPSLEPELPLLIDFLGLSEPGTQVLRLDPATRRERLINFFRSLFREMNSRFPYQAVTLLEDLHWMDDGSASLIELYAEMVQGTRLLMVVNYRPDFAIPWMADSRFEQISLAPLGENAADSLACRLLGDDESVVPLLPLIADRARGNPLFIEELVWQLAESGHIAGEPGAYRLVRAPDMKRVPATVQAIIGTRIDSRPEIERSILQTAAVIGREFSIDVLSRLVSGLTEELGPILQRLSSAGLIYESGASEGKFAFKHPMVQEVAYRSLLSERRRSLHAAIVTELEKSHLEPTGAQASFIAYHLAEAGRPMEAASYHMKAAEWFGARNFAGSLVWDRVRDPAQALDSLRRAHGLLAGQPLDDSGRKLLLLAAGQIVNFGQREGLTAAALKPYYSEAMQIARELGSKTSIVLVTGAYGYALGSSGSADEFVSLANEALSIVGSAEEAGLAVRMRMIRCHANRLVGDLRAALADTDWALDNACEVGEKHEQDVDFDTLGWIKRMRGQVLTLMGRYDEAQTVLNEVILSNKAASQADRILAHGAMTDIAYGLGDLALASEHSAAAYRLAEARQNSYYISYSRVCAGLELFMRGSYAKAMAMFDDALHSTRQRQGGREAEAMILGHLAHTQMRAGLLDRALATAEEAADVARRRGTKVSGAYAEWLLNGPTSPTFAKLIEETGAHHLMRLPNPRPLRG